MRITNAAIKYRTSIVVLTLLLVAGGLYSYLTIPKEAQPSIEIPTIVVTTIYPGASPDDVESVVTQVIEQELSSINGIDELRSISTEGVSTIVIEFTPDVAMSEASQQVRENVDIAKADLPDDTEEPLIDEIDTSEFPILTVNFAAKYSLARLKQVAEDVQDEIEGIPSVLEADLVGGLEREVQVDVDLNALQGYGLSFNDLIRTIEQENTNLPGGSIDVDRLNYLVSVDGQFDDPEREIAELVVKAEGNSTVYVRDVANVRFGFKDRDSYARLKVLREEENDELRRVSDLDTEMLQVISLNVKKRAGDNILDTVAEVKALLDGYPFPSGTQVTLTGDRSEQVKTLVTDLENNIISGLLFVIAVLLFFLGVRNATLVGIAIPLSMFVTFLVFQALGYTLNFIILFSLIIALGMLVDNAVVIVENIYRFKENGYSNFEAAKQATAEVGGAVVAATATTVAAFVPMLFWPTVIGEFMGYLPLTLIITLTSSLFVAIIINPVITGIFVKVEGQEDDDKREWSPSMRWAGAGAILFLGLLLGLANWQTLLVIVIAVPTLYLMHTRIFKPVGDRFVQTGLPALIDRYKAFANRVLERDYSVPYAMLRNTGALMSLTLGLLITAAGGAMSSVGPSVGFAGGLGAGGLMLLVPGGLLLVIGLLGIVVHTIEALLRGGWTSVKAGLGLGAVMAAILAVIYTSPRPLSLLTMAEMMLVPALIAGGGLVGVLLSIDKPLIVTDNRTSLLSGSIAALFIIFGMYGLAPTGFEFFPSTDPNLIQVTLDAPLGTNVESSNRVAEEARTRIDDLLDSAPDAEGNVKSMTVNVGVGGDSQFGGGAQRSERSEVTLNMVDYQDRTESSSATLAALRSQLQGIPGVDIDFSQDESGPPTGPPVNIEIAGPEFETIVDISEDIKALLEDAADSGDIPGLVDIRDDLNTGRPELSVDIDRERAAQFGLSTLQIAQTVRAAINGAEASTFRDGEDEYDITVRLREADRNNLESLKNLTVVNTRGRDVPLVSVADLREGTGFGSITRLDRKRVVTVQADAAPGFNGPEVLGNVRQTLSDYQAQELPTGYSMSYTGENEDMNESFNFLTLALLIGGALITMVLIAQFNSISAPFIIMVAVGLSLIGVLLGLILTRTPFGLMTFIGLISLAGIVVNNSIVLVDYVMQLRDQGMEKREAIIEGGATRLRPVLLTALTTILGLIPLTFGINIDFVGLLTDLDPKLQFGSENTQFWGPMGTAIISGLAFGTFLTLVVVPVLYSAFDSLAQRLAYTTGTQPAAASLGGNGVPTAGDGAAPSVDTTLADDQGTTPETSSDV